MQRWFELARLNLCTEMLTAQVLKVLKDKSQDEYFSQLLSLSPFLSIPSRLSFYMWPPSREECQQPIKDHDPRHKDSLPTSCRRRQISSILRWRLGNWRISHFPTPVIYLVGFHNITKALSKKFRFSTANTMIILSWYCFQNSAMIWNRRPDMEAIQNVFQFVTYNKYNHCTGRRVDKNSILLLL